ncbi:MAG: hypothetical protein HFJ97_08030 [Eubacterium sp.]|nr:hypothetical protein [Eubacterium sp.]
MQRKMYKTPEFEVQLLNDVNAVITTSGLGGGDEVNGGDIDWDFGFSSDF